MLLGVSAAETLVGRFLMSYLDFIVLTFLRGAC
jgi:hypothetical protein